MDRSLENGLGVLGVFGLRWIITRKLKNSFIRQKLKAKVKRLLNGRTMALLSAYTKKGSGNGPGI